MHDFLLAKEIVDEISKIAKNRGIAKIKRVVLEIGNISLAHDGIAEHAEEINLENLQFGMRGIGGGTSLLDTAEFEIQKTSGGAWKIVEIEV